MSIFIAGTTAYINAGSTVLTGTASPAPPSGYTSYDYINTDGTFGYRSWTLPGDGAWQFRELIYVDSVVGQPSPATAGPDLDFIAFRNTNDTVNAMIIREQGRGLLRITETGGTFPWTGTTQIPVGAWYLLQGYGNATNNTARVCLCNLDGSLITDSGSITVAQGSTGPTTIRFGKLSAASGWAGKVAWCGMELRTGTDAAQALLGPYAGSLTVADALTPANPQPKTQVRTLTLTPTGGSGKAITYTVTSWGDGTTGSSNTTGIFTHTYANDGTYSITWSYTQAA